MTTNTNKLHIITKVGTDSPFLYTKPVYSQQVIQLLEDWI